jgi:hypothetical protein
MPCIFYRTQAIRPIFRYAKRIDALLAHARPQPEGWRYSCTGRENRKLNSHNRTEIRFRAASCTEIGQVRA